MLACTHFGPRPQRHFMFSAASCRPQMRLSSLNSKLLILSSMESSRIVDLCPGSTLLRSIRDLIKRICTTTNSTETQRPSNSSFFKASKRSHHPDETEINEPFDGAGLILRLTCPTCNLTVYPRCLQSAWYLRSFLASISQSLCCTACLLPPGLSVSYPFGIGYQATERIISPRAHPLARKPQYACMHACMLACAKAIVCSCY